MKKSNGHYEYFIFEDVKNYNPPQLKIYSHFVSDDVSKYNDQFQIKDYKHLLFFIENFVKHHKYKRAALFRKEFEETFRKLL